MKNLIVIFILLFGYNNFANSLVNDVITISGKTERVNVIKRVLEHGLRAERKTATIVTRYNDGYMKNGEYSQITVNHQNRYVQLSDSMLKKTYTEINKSDSDVSFRDIIRVLCTEQGNVVLDTIADVSSPGYTNYNEPPCDGCNVDLTETHQKLDRLGEDHKNILYGQDQMYALMQQIAACQGAWSQFEVINVNYQTRGSLSSAQEKLDHLKMKYPCLPQDLTIERANKGWQWLKENAPEIAFGVINTVQNKQIMDREVIIRNIDNFVQPDPNVNTPGHNESRVPINQPGARMVINKAFQRN